MSIYQRRASLKKFIQYSTQVYHTNHALRSAESRPGPRSARSSPRTDELKRILGHLPMWMRVFTLLCRMMGLRHSEALAMTPAALQPAPSKTLSFNRKMGGTSNIPVPVELQSAIEFARSTNPPLANLLESLGMRANKNPPRGHLAILEEGKKKAKAQPGPAHSRPTPHHRNRTGERHKGPPRRADATRSQISQQHDPVHRTDGPGTTSEA